MLHNCATALHFLTVLYTKASMSIYKISPAVMLSPAVQVTVAVLIASSIVTDLFCDALASYVINLSFALFGFVSGVNAVISRAAHPNTTSVRTTMLVIAQPAHVTVASLPSPAVNQVVLMTIVPELSIIT